MTHEEFIEQECRLCGTQRCYGEEYCGKYQKMVNGENLTSAHPMQLMMSVAKQQILLHKALHNDCAVIDVRTKEQKRLDELDLTDEEYDTIAEEAHDNLVRSLVEAGGEIRELRELLARAYEQLMLLGYDSGFTNEEIHKLANDIAEYLEEIKQ